VAILREEKALNLVAIDVSGKCDLVNTMIMLEGRSGRHLRAMAARLHDEARLRQAPSGKPQASAMDAQADKNDDWIVVDTGNIFIHLFSPSARRYYDLEALWVLRKLKHDRDENGWMDDEDQEEPPDLDDVPGGWNPWDQTIEED